MHSPVYRRSPGRITLRHYVVSIIALLILPGCNGDDLLEAEVDCPTVSDGPADLATVDTGATPRADASAEIFALEVSGEFIAPEALFQRVRSSFPEVAHIEARGCHDPGSVIVAFTAQGFQQVQEGTYNAWDDVNANLRLTWTQEVGQRREQLPRADRALYVVAFALPE